MLLKSLSNRVASTIFALLLAPLQVEAFTTHPIRHQGLHSTRNALHSCDGNFAESDQQRDNNLNRRETIGALLGSTAALTFTQAAAASDSAPPSVVSPLETLQRLRKVPTYTLVDSSGVPFMTYDSKTATADGFFFLDYANAQAVLLDAQQAYERAKEEGKDGVPETWGASRIVTVPLDFAMRLTVTQTSNVAQNGKSFRTNYQVLPSAVSSTCG